jgi:GT2 family glycosyltransferase
MNLYLRNLIEYTQEFGLFSAVLLIIQRKLHCKTIRINPKGIKHWIECRNGTSDFAVLRQVIGKKDSLLKIGGWNERFDCCQDNEVCLRAIQAGLKFSFCPDPGAVYRIWSENTVCRKNPQRVISTKTQLIDAMFEWLKATAKLQASHVAAAGRMSF